jgi:hypothetical protein
MVDQNKISGAWTVRDIELDVKTAVKKAAKKRGITVSAWMNEALRNAAVQDLKEGQDVSSTIVLGEEVDTMKAALMEQQKTLLLEMGEIKALITDRSGEPEKGDRKSKGKGKKRKDKKK